MWIYLCVVFVYLLIVVAFQATMVFIYRRWLLSGQLPTSPSDAQPSATVVLSVRGLDPSLENCLAGLRDQEYSNYQVLVIVDHEQDPAYSVVKKITDSSPGKFQLMVGETPSGTCSLKCDRLVQAIESVSDSCEIVCLIDADTVPDKLWLSSLVAPFKSEKVAAVTGNRWFHPIDFGIGSLLRSMWNSAAVVQMYVYEIAWGGSLAIRRSAIQETKLSNKWRSAMFEDVLIRDHFRKHKMKLVSAPEVLVENTEQVSLTGASSWITRQLLDARLYHRKWPLVLLHSCSTTFLWIAMLVGFAMALIIGPPTLCYGFFLLMAGYFFANFLLLYVIGDTAQDAIENRRAQCGDNKGQRWLSPKRIAQMLICIPLLQFFHFRATLVAMFQRMTAWRGCRYKIKRPFQVQLERYSVFGSTENSISAKDSERRSIE